MALDPDLMQLLACPSDDHAPLREQRRGGDDVLVCTHCASIYPIDDGIPVLLLDEAEPGPNGLGNTADGLGNSADGFGNAADEPGEAADAGDAAGP